MPISSHAPGESNPAAGRHADSTATPTAPGPGVETELLCERCGNVNLIRVKGCWYCERCHYKFDCYGW